MKIIYNFATTQILNPALKLVLVEQALQATNGLSQPTEIFIQCYLAASTSYIVSNSHDTTVDHFSLREIVGLRPHPLCTAAVFCLS